MRKVQLLLLFAIATLFGSAQTRQNRGLLAFVNGKNVQVSWRMRANDNPTTTQYLLYIDGILYGTFRSKTTVRVSSARYANSTFKLVVKDATGTVIDEQDDIKALPHEYLDIPMLKPVTPNCNATYTPGDASAYDMDGDGEQEIIVKWMSSVTVDSVTKIPAHEFFDCYKLNGKRLWRIDMGQNAEVNNSATFFCYDFDGDGKGEFMIKSAPGTKEATGSYVGKGLPGYPKDLEKVYYRSRQQMGSVTKGEEWLTLFDGATGKELASKQYWPYFGIQEDWDSRPGKKHVDGVDYGKRGNGVKGAVLRIPCRDGKVRPVACWQRGIYNYVYATAISWNGKNLTEEWRHSSDKENSSTTVNSTGTHHQNLSLFSQGAHQGQAGDLDGDGYDELMIGAAAIDHDGTVLWSTGLGHGDAEGVGEFNPYNKGLEAWRITEVGTEYDACMMDGKTGHILNGQPYTTGDVGRGIIMDLDSTHAGSEYWFMTSQAIFDCKGDSILPVNRHKTIGYPSYRIYWDFDFCDEHFDGALIGKYDIKSKKWNRCVKSVGNNTSLWKYYHVHTINSTKKNPLLQCDLLGDWREELVMYTTPEYSNLSDCDYVMRIITTTYETDKKLPWLRDDHVYDIQIANQNVGYSMPPHLSYNPFDYYKSLGKMGKDELAAQSDDNTDPTAIKNVTTSRMNDDKWYDLSGRQVKKPVKGVYINRGQKVIID